MNFSRKLFEKINDFFFFFFEKKFILKIFFFWNIYTEKKQKIKKISQKIK